MKASRIATAGALIILTACVALSQSTNNLPADADFAWQAVVQATTLPATYTQQELQQHFVAAAAKAKAFYIKFPDSANVIAAKTLECTMLQGAYAYSSDPDARKQAYNTLAKAQSALLADSRLTDDQRFDVRVQVLQRERNNPEGQLDWQASQDAYEKGLHQLIKDYPKNDKAYELLLIFGAESSDDRARSIANEILADPVSDDVKEKAHAILHRLDAIGKPLDIKFVALDCRKVDLTDMKGKVVLVDFWATWCGPCVGEIPHVKEAYEKLHAKGFEIVGISFDSDQGRLTDFIQTHEMPWPQYFDGKQWLNKFGRQYAIDSIPTMWLVDKKGNLADSNARDDLQGKVEKLLAEN